MNKLVLFSVDSPENRIDNNELKIIEGLLTTSGIQTDFQDGSFHCLANTRNQLRLIVSIAESYQQDSLISVDLKNNLAYCHFFSGLNVKFMGYWKYEETYNDGTRKLLLTM